MREIIIIDVYNITGVGTVVVAKVAQGSIKEGDSIQVGNKIAKITMIEKKHKRVSYAMENELVGIGLSGVDKREVKKGNYKII